jgi:hypothetical protein
MSHKCKGNAGSTEESPSTQVFLESHDGAFRGVVAMAVRWHQLVRNTIDSEEIFETLDCELLMDGIICVYPFRGGPRFHVDDFNVVAIRDIEDHHIRVSFAGSHRELSRQVDVELALIDYDGVHEVGLRAQIRVRCWLFPNRSLPG